MKAPGVTKRLEALGRQGRSGKPQALAPEGHSWTRRLTPLVSGAGRCPWGRGGVFNLRKERGDQHVCPLLGAKLQRPSAPRLSLSPGILGLLAPSPIKRNNVLPADASLTHGALLPVWPCLQPLKRKHKVCSNTKRVFKVPNPFHFPVHLMSTLPDEDRANWMEETEEKTRKQVKLQQSHRHRTGAHCTGLPRYCLLYCYVSFQSFCNFQQTCSLNFSSFSHLQYLKFFHLQYTWYTPPSLSLLPPLTPPSTSPFSAS